MSSSIDILVEGPQSGPHNMRVDQENLRTVDTAAQTLTLVRIYQWDRPTVSVGKHQVPELSFDLPWCSKKRIPWVRRPTGGRAVLHDHEVTYSVASNDPHLFPLSDISGTYRTIARILAVGLNELGIETHLAPGEPHRTGPPASGRQSPCFSSSSRYELVWQGRKIAGSAQRRLRRGFLQHGSIPLEIDYTLMGRVLGVAPVELRARMSSLSEATQRRVLYQEAARALAKAFQHSLRPLRSESSFTSELRDTLPPVFEGSEIAVHSESNAEDCGA